MRRAAKVDMNHAAIVKALRKIGCLVWDTSRMGGGFPDAIACLGYRVKMLEFKTPGGKLTPQQEKFHGQWRKHACVVETPEQAIAEMTR